MSGIAPGAWLGNYNVFPDHVASARSEDILNAVDAAIAQCRRDPTAFWSARWEAAQRTSANCAWSNRAAEWEHMLAKIDLSNN